MTRVECEVLRDVLAPFCALLQLSAKQREVFVDYELVGHSLAEIATRHGITRSSAQTHLDRARKKLRQLPFEVAA